MIRFALILLTLLASAAALEAGESDAGWVSSFYPFSLEHCTSDGVGNTGLTRCDPVNLLFEGQSWEQVTELLVAAGWTTDGYGSQQFLLREGVLVPDTEQLFLNDSEGGGRYHIRLWQVGDTVTAGGVHHESPGHVPVFHQIDKDWEAAENFVEQQICPRVTACIHTQPIEGQGAVQEGLDWRGWSNDTRALLAILG